MTVSPHLAFAATALWLAVAAPAAAQAPTCRLPQSVTPAPERPPPRGEVSLTRADHMVLAVTWSPEWCRTHARDAGAGLQCRQNSFGFVLHGLWPSTRDGDHPRYCRPAPPLAPATVRANLCMTPSIELLQHEWAAHGTCGWPTSAAYFEQASTLWNRLSRPTPRNGMTAGELRTAFVRANPGLPHDAVNVRVASGNRLLEVGVCHDLAFRPAACPRGVGTPDKVVLKVTPQR
ncbi:MAG: ribonuclease T [Phenylobacterium zucineum]|nr:MAG: ribonuclease T [Phenylobacterium zucineum]